MSGYKGHLTGGFVAAVVCTAVVSATPAPQLAQYAGLMQSWQTLAGVFVIAMLFALFPDVDTKSKGQGIFYWTVFLCDLLLIWSKHFEAAAYLGIVAVLPLLGKHRGWTHSKWAAFLIPLPILIVPYLANDNLLPVSVVYYGAAVVGYLSHLLLDGLIVSWVRVRSRQYE